MYNIQNSEGGPGNDLITIFAGETVGCQVVEGQAGVDVLSLIGFGPYTVFPPFPPFDWLIEQDPISGGFIFVSIDDDAGDVMEFINGLTTPNPVLITQANFDNELASRCLLPTVD